MTTPNPGTQPDFPVDKSPANQDGRADPSARYTRNATIISLVTAIFGAALSLVNIYLLVYLGGSVGSLVLSIFPFLAALISFWLVRRGRTSLGIAVLVIGLIGVSLFYPLLTVVPGITVALIVLVLVSGIASATLPTRWVNYAVLASLVSGGLVILLDFFVPQPDVAGFPEVTTAFTIGLILVYGLYIAWQFRYYPLRTKLIVAFITVVLLSGGIIAVFTQLSTSRFHEQTIGLNLGSRAQVQALSVGSLLEQQLDLLTALSLDQNVQDTINSANVSYTGMGAGDIQAEVERLDQEWRAAVETDATTDPLVESRIRNSLALHLRSFRREYPEHVEIFVTDRFGALASSTNPTSDYYQADEAWWQAAYNDGLGGIYIGDPEYDESAGEYAVIMAVPIRNPFTGSLVGVFRSTYSLEALNELLFGIEVGGAGETDLVFPGETIQAIHEGGLEELDPETVEGLQASAGEVYAEFYYEAEPNLVAQAEIQSLKGNPTIADLGWIVALHQPLEEAMAPVSAQARTTLLLGLVTIGIVSVGAILLSQYLSGPIVRLTGVAERVAGGELNARAVAESQDEIGALATTFNTMTGQLQRTLEGLEQRVAERTRAIELSADVSRRLSTILDQTELVSEVVELLQFSFDYYHVHIYLFDQVRENLVMVGGTGEAGRTMMEGGHKLSRGRGLVGRACESAQVVLVPDTRQDPNWLPNPLLPETKAEIAVPILLGDQVLGALDVQDDQVGGLDEEDSDLLQGIAGQVAIALRNAQQYAEAQRRAERQALTGEIVGQIQSAQTIESALQVAVRELGRALKVPRTQAKISLGGDENERE